MFEKITPESAGISSAAVAKFIRKIESRGAIMHSLLLVRHGKVFAEHYWAPFNENSLQRMYSQTKSYTALAIGLLEEEGKLSLDDKIADLFPEKIDGEIGKHIKELTVRNMLTMTTSGGPHNWFLEGDPDRTHNYFNNRDFDRASGTFWKYDSAGSQVLCALAEKLSGMKLIDYLREKVFNKVGTFKNARVLMCANNDSWGDSALLCTTRDMASGGQLLMQGGKWNGEQLINEKFVKDACSALVNNRTNWCRHALDSEGYGYQIWRAPQNGFAFVGMGDQLTICLPDKDFMFVCTADHQAPADAGEKPIRTMLINAVYDFIYDNLADEPLPEDESAYNAYLAEFSNLELACIKGKEDSPLREKINGVTYACEPNPLGWTKFTFNFKDKTEGELHYTNAQGDKVMPFGINKNAYGYFPQLGYSNEHGTVETTDGFMYKDAVALSWMDDNKLIVEVKIIDTYLGTCSGVFGFSGDYAAAHFEKAAEHFLDEYQGEIAAKAVK